MREHARGSASPRTTVDLSQAAKGKEAQNPVHEANEDDYHEEEIRDLPLNNLECGPAAPRRHLLVPPVERSVPEKRNVKEEFLST